MLTWFVLVCCSNLWELVGTALLLRATTSSDDLQRTCWRCLFRREPWADFHSIIRLVINVLHYLSKKKHVRSTPQQSKRSVPVFNTKKETLIAMAHVSSSETVGLITGFILSLLVGGVYCTASCKVNWKTFYYHSSYMMPTTRVLACV